MHSVGVRGGMHGDRRDAQLLAGPQDPKSDLATIGYEDFIKHDFQAGELRWEVARGPGWTFAVSRSPVAYSMMTSGSPNSTGCPSSTRICVTVPARGEGIWFIVFIASMIRSVCPTSTLAPTSMKGLAPGSGAQ